MKSVKKYLVKLFSEGFQPSRNKEIIMMYTYQTCLLALVAPIGIIPPSSNDGMMVRIMGFIMNTYQPQGCLSVFFVQWIAVISDEQKEISFLLLDHQ